MKKIVVREDEYGWVAIMYNRLFWIWFADFQCRARDYSDVMDVVHRWKRLHSVPDHLVIIKTQTK